MPALKAMDPMYRAADPAAAIEMAESRSGLVAEPAAGPRKVSTLVSGSAIESRGLPSALIPNAISTSPPMIMMAPLTRWRRNATPSSGLACAAVGDKPRGLSGRCRRDLHRLLGVLTMQIDSVGTSGGRLRPNTHSPMNVDSRKNASRPFMTSGAAGCSPRTPW